VKPLRTAEGETFVVSVGVAWLDSPTPSFLHHHLIDGAFSWKVACVTETKLLPCTAGRPVEQGATP
jgi:hypothetical protein